MRVAGICVLIGYMYSDIRRKCAKFSSMVVPV